MSTAMRYAPTKHQGAQLGVRTHYVFGDPPDAEGRDLAEFIFGMSAVLPDEWNIFALYRG